MDNLTNWEKVQIIQKYLADPKTTGGRDRLFNHLRKDYGSQITRREVASVLADDETHQIHRPLNKRITGRPIVISDRAKMGFIDLIDFKGLTGWNDHRRYALTYVDGLSKYCGARTITLKTAVNVNAALQELLDSMPASWRPKTIAADNGSEFQSLMQRSLAERGIKLVHGSTYSPLALIERFNRTLKTDIFDQMTRHKTNRWIDILQDLISNYNNSVHESTNHTPLELMRRPVLQKEVVAEIHKRMQNQRPHHEPVEFAVDDFVRVALTTESSIRKQRFRKKIAANWSAEVFQIYAVSEPETVGTQPSYLLKNLMTNRKSKKRYYSYQLQEITPEAASSAVAQGVHSAREHPRNKPPAEPDEVASEEEAPAPPRRSARAYAPSAQALQNLAQAPSRWGS